MKAVQSVSTGANDRAVFKPCALRYELSGRATSELGEGAGAYYGTDAWVRRHQNECDKSLETPSDKTDLLGSRHSRTVRRDQLALH